MIRAQRKRTVSIKDQDIQTILFRNFLQADLQLKSTRPLQNSSLKKSLTELVCSLESAECQTP